MTMRVRCDDRSGCVAEADAPEGASWEHLREAEPNVMAADVPHGWTTNRGLGGTWEHYCPRHPQPEIAGG